MIDLQNNSNNLQARTGVGGFASSVFESKRKKDGIFTNNEPISVLDTRSPSPSTSTSTFSSFNPQGNMVLNEPTSAAAYGGGGREEWVADLLPSVHNLGLEFSHELCENANFALQDLVKLEKQDEILKLLLPAGNQNEVQQIQGFGFKNSEFAVLPSYNISASGISGNVFSLNECKGKFGLDSNILLTENNVLSFQQDFEALNPQRPLDPVLIRNTVNPKPNELNPSIFRAHQNVGCVTFVNPCNQLLPLKQQHLPLVDVAQCPDVVRLHEAAGGCSEQTGVDSHQQRQFVYDEVYKAAELIQAGDLSNAQGILARLNHILAPTGKPFLRSAFYVKEALELTFSMPIQRIPAPFDGMLKMGAYKVFSEVSPVIQFMNFTANQILLEAVRDSDKIHIIDFDIGFGAHWSSFLQEIPSKNRGVKFVKITAFASPSTHHSLEISLMHQNLTEFASGLGINFELEVVNIDCFDPNCISVSSLRSSESEVIAVNLPIWSFASYLSALPSYLCLIKQLSPKIVVSLSRGCERIDLPFSHHILHTLQYYEALLDSVDAANVNSDACNKIERFLFQPRIESTVLGHLLNSNTMPPWRNIFASVGYLPVSIVNFAETQAQCLLKRMQVKGFRVERKEASLLLWWKRCELLSVSAWKC